MDIFLILLLVVIISAKAYFDHANRREWKKRLHDMGLEPVILGDGMWRCYYVRPITQTKERPQND
jgi:hypothetical protein